MHLRDPWRLNSVILHCVFHRVKQHESFFKCPPRSPTTPTLAPPLLVVTPESIDCSAMEFNGDNGGTSRRQQPQQPYGDDGMQRPPPTTTISTVVVHRPPIKVVIALLQVRPDPSKKSNKYSKYPRDLFTHGITSMNEMLF